MMRERLKIRFTSSGVASVATSKSLGVRFSSKSRTAPPTIYASKPALCKPSVVFSAALLNRSRSILCVLYAMESAL